MTNYKYPKKIVNFNSNWLNKELSYKAFCITAGKLRHKSLQNLPLQPNLLVQHNMIRGHSEGLAIDLGVTDLGCDVMPGNQAVALRKTRPYTRKV